MYVCVNFIKTVNILGEENHMSVILWYTDWIFNRSIDRNYSFFGIYLAAVPFL